MAKEKELNVEERLKALYELQTILSEVDRIKTLRGELPLEVQDLEDEIEGLQTRISKYDEEIAALNATIKEQSEAADKADAMVAKYTKDQDNVRNNREYDFLTKEIEYQQLNIELAEKKINDAKHAIDVTNANMDAAKTQLETALTCWLKRRVNSTKSSLRLSKTKKNFVKKRRNSKPNSTTSVCSTHSSALVRMLATVLASCMCRVTLAVVASTAFLHSVRAKSRCTRR